MTSKKPNGMEKISCVLCGSKNYRLLFQTVDFKVSHLWFEIVKCNSCNLVFTNPRPLENEVGNYYPNNYYSYKSYRPKKENIKKSTNQYKILDIGCGTGKWLHKQKILGYDVYGIEISRKAVRIANEMELNVVFAKLEEAKFPHDFFDLIRLHHVAGALIQSFEVSQRSKKNPKKEWTMYH